MNTAITLGKTLKPDSKGRISIGSLIADGIDSFRAYVDADHRIILEPLAEIPARELWLYKTPTAIKSVKKGLMQSKQNKVKSLGNFSKYLKD